MRLKILNYYKRREILEFIYEYSYNREVAMFNEEGKIITKRPWYIMNEGDIILKAKEGGVSIHATTERWYDVDALSELNTKKYYENLESFDIVLDFDLKLYDNDKKNFVLAKMIIKEFIDILNRLDLEGSFFIKFSGNKGFHLVFPYINVPTEIDGLNVKKYKEEVYRSVLTFFDRVLRLTIKNIEKEYGLKILEKLKDTIIDLHMASWRHMIRVPYSIHEKTGLVSVIIDEEDITKFKREHADPSNVYEPYMPDIKKKSLKDIILLSLAYSYFHDISRKSGRIAIKKIKKLPEDDLPPCVKLLLEGVPVGIRNNTMFFLINFFRSLGYSKEQVEVIIKEWNEKNSEPLREREVEYAIEYHFSRAKYAPYSCEKIREYIGRTYCQPNEICRYIKHPLQYVRLVRKLRKRKNEKK